MFLSVAEVDRVLKKVEEGVEEFDDIWGKVRENRVDEERKG